MKCLDLVRLSRLMELTSGSPHVVIGLIDGPVALDHPDLVHVRVREAPGAESGTCGQAIGMACLHGTFVAGILFAKRGSEAPAICPNCTLLTYPIFSETARLGRGLPSAQPQALAQAIVACTDAGAHVLNISAGIAQPSPQGVRALEEALDYAARRGATVVAAAGNEGTLGSTAVTRHPWVIPVVAYDSEGRPTALSNLGGSIGRRGLGAAGDRVTSLAAEGGTITMGGTSAAVPFVTGAIALLRAIFPAASAAAVRLAVTQASAQRRNTVVPPLLDAWAAYQGMAKTEFSTARVG